MTNDGYRAARAALAMGLLLLHAACGGDEERRDPTPELVSMTPTGASVPRSAWLVLDFAGPVAEAALDDLALSCGGSISVLATLVGVDRVVVNPEGLLPASADCELRWLGPKGDERARFHTAADGEPAFVEHDRDDPGRIAPFPDDFFTVEDASTPSGIRVAIPPFDRPIDVAGAQDALASHANTLDGFSPLAHLVVTFSDAPDPQSLPATARDSLDPLSTVLLLDLDGAVPGAHVPFVLRLRSDVGPGGETFHYAGVFPVGPLRSGGTYALVVTRRALVSPSRPLAPSSFSSRALAPVAAGESEALGRVRAITADVLERTERDHVPPIHSDDVALVLRFHVRTTDGVPADILSMREQLEAGPPPTFVVDEARPGPAGSDLAAVIHGTWHAPAFLRGRYVERDARGRPVRLEPDVPVPFVLALPRRAEAGPVPLVIYQHGQPGSAEEVLQGTAQALARRGLAVAAFTDPVNRAFPVGPGEDLGAWRSRLVGATLLDVLGAGEAPEDDGAPTTAEQLAFVRMWRARDLDLLPLDAPDGLPEVEADGPMFYVGISQGSRHGTRLLPYTSDLLAAALVVGGGWNAAGLLHQAADSLYSGVAALLPSITPPEVWVGMALYQTMLDDGDPGLHAGYLYSTALDSAERRRPASVLVLEGLGDSFVPFFTTEGTALAMGIPQLEPVWRDTVLPVVQSPVRANIDARTTAAFYQYVPAGYAGVAATPSCAASDQREGHFCPQIATEAALQVERFFATALSDEAPTIVDPLSP